MRPPEVGQRLWLVRGERGGPKRPDPHWKARAAGHLPPVEGLPWVHVYARRDHAYRAAGRETAEGFTARVLDVAPWPSGVVLTQPEGGQLLWYLAPHWYLTERAAQRRHRKVGGQGRVVAVGPWESVHW